MEYLLLIYQDEKLMASMSADALKAMYGGYEAFTEELVASGAMRGGNELKPIATATSLRVRNGKVLLTDGPFAETREQLGGYYLIDVADIDEALKWAAKIPTALDGTVEVRPAAANG